MSSLDEEIDELSELRDLAFKSGIHNPGFQVSGWDDEDDGIEEDKNPHENDEKELLWAAEHGKIDIVRKILARNQPEILSTKDKDGYTPLHRACYEGNNEIVKILLEAGATYDAKTNDEWQPLHSACKWNRLECAVLLLSYGADVNAASVGGVTPLHLAAGHKDGQQLLQLLLCQPELKHNIKDTSGDTPADIARRSTPSNSCYFEIIEPCFL